MPKKEHVHDADSAIIRDVILGGQDGLVNVLGIVLAVAEATQSRYIILISGLAATFAESISMAAVAYTSAKAGKEFYRKKRLEAEKNPKIAKRTLSEMFAKCGLRGTMLNKAIQSIMSSKKRLKSVLATQEGEQAEEFEHPIRDACVVGFAAIVGSFIPLIAFMFFPIEAAVWTTLAVSTIALFISGYVKASYTGAVPLKSGTEMAIVGMTAALAGYFIGILLGAVPV